MRMVLCLFLCFSLLNTALIAGEFEVSQQEDGVTINLQGKLFARYVTKGHSKPVIWPIIGPTGKEMTRAFPFKKGVEGEKDDHEHHESFWFDHGDVNGVDFWMIKESSGKIIHREFLKVEGGDAAKLVAKNDWIGPTGKKICEDLRTIQFGADDENRWIDFEVRVLATEGEVKFGDTKEGSFGIRVPTTMDVTAKKGGRIVNSEGLVDEATWGKAAKWVDYTGPVAGEQLGIAIFNHPRSFRYPTTWHVRTYGLFAANPFGAKEFNPAAKEDGAHVIKAGESMQLAYRVLFHRGATKPQELEKAFEQFAGAKLTSP